MVVADIDFSVWPIGYGFFAVADIVVLWPIWFVADMTAPRSHQWWNFMFTDILQNVTDYHTVFNLVRSQQRAQHARQIQ